MNPAQKHSHRLLLNDSSPSKPHTDNKERTSIIVLVAFIIMAALTLTILLFLYRYVCRHFNHSDPTPTMSSQSDELAALPKFIYDDSCSASCSSATKSSLEPETNCPICLVEFLRGEELRVLPRCKHIYHKECIDQWLVLRSLHCPICRDRTIEPDVEPEKSNCTNSGVGLGDPSMSLALGFANHPVISNL